MNWINNEQTPELESTAIYIGYARYAQFGKWEWIAVIDTSYSDEKLQEAVYDLDSSDIPAIEASNYIEKAVKDGYAYIGKGNNPVTALADAVRVYGEVLS